MGDDARARIDAQVDELRAEADSKGWGFRIVSESATEVVCDIRDAQNVWRLFSVTADVARESEHAVPAVEDDLFNFIKEAYPARTRKDDRSLPSCTPKYDARRTVEVKAVPYGGIRRAFECADAIRIIVDVNPELKLFILLVEF